MSDTTRPRSTVTVERGVPITMEDGTVLVAEILRPADDGVHPVVLVRSPYPDFVARAQLDQVRTAQMGFAVVVQSVRGTGASEGDFEPWVHEAADGATTVEWCARQPWSSGSVVMYGDSYLGSVQLYAAAAAPPALKAISPGVVPSEPYDVTYEGGALLLGSAQGWAVQQIGFDLLEGRHAGADSIAPRWFAAASQPSLTRRPPLRAHDLLAESFPTWVGWVDHPDHDEWWHRIDVPLRPPVPAFFVGGWWDLFLRGTVAEWARPGRHPASRLVIGPWSHLIAGQAHGPVDYGFGAAAAHLDLQGQRLAFLARHAGGLGDEQQANLPSAPPVSVFLMGAGRWLDLDAWPPPYSDVEWFGHADGRLTTDRSTETSAALSYLFDPADPVPTTGGRNLIAGSDGAHQTGPVDQRPLDARCDIVRLVSVPLDDTVDAVGEVVVEAFVTSTAVSFDVTAKLIDVHPDGVALNVVDGIARVQSGPSVDRAAPTRIRVELGPTAYRFLAGHRIRLDLSSSNFPRFDLNPGTGRTSADTALADFVTATQTVHLDAHHPTRLILPTFDEAAARPT